MSTNGVNITDDTDMAECEEEKVVTMMDVLQEQQEFEDDANAVLGASDDKNCTYPKGYIKRQAIYACLTCCVDAKIDPTKRAGVCLACSLNCHENHELIELYTKRSFRCDCGNPKFNNHPCQFISEKPELNEDNCYNQNFSGLYCTCHRPYPDPEATFEDEMIQCIVCEDWLHSAHLEAGLPTNDYAEMICKACMEKNEFLHSYSDFAINSEAEDVDIISLANDTSDNNSIECNGVVENVNGGIDLKDSNETNNETEVEMAETEKVESEHAAVESITDVQKNTDVADSTDDNINTPANDTVPNGTDDIETSEDTKEETPESADLSKSDKIDAEKKNDSVVDSSSKCIESIKETMDIKDTTAPLDVNRMETEEQNNDNSIIESIEKLENELGNTEQHTEEKHEENTDATTRSVNNETVADESISIQEKTDAECSNSILNVNKTTDILANTESCDDEETSHKNELGEEINSDGVVPENTNTDNPNNKENKQTTENGISDKNSSELIDSETKIQDNHKETKRKLSSEELDDVTSKKPKLDDKNCIRPKDVKRRLKGATFWPNNFRQKLCTCCECISMYKELSVLFLTDPDDTVTAYETLGRLKIDGTATSQYEKGLEALTSLGRIQQINALTEYNKMRDKLLDYLKSFKDRKEIVKEEDIKAFFAGMKPKRESDGVYFCR